MIRPHDMGGRQGDGPVAPGWDEPMFTKPWHRHAMALTIASGALGAWSIDASRFTRETLPDYATISYYEKWVNAVADLAVDRGLLTRAELAGTLPDQSPLAPRALRAADVPRVLANGSPSARPGPASAFAPGDTVRARAVADNALRPGGHTRLPAYAAGHIGRIVTQHGPHVLPDSNAHALGEAAEPLYTVAFPATALWPDAEDAGDEVMVDLWQSYLSRT